MTDRSRLAVLGSPIAHSKSPAIHAAAYAALGLDWRYEAIEVDTASLGPFLDGLDARWRGLSLTMPLKRDVVPRLATRSALVDLVGGANTVRVDEHGLHGINTDVHGIVAALRGAGLDHAETVLVLGSGATAASVLAAAADRGAARVRVLARTPANAAPLQALAARLGLGIEVLPLAGVIDDERGEQGSAAFGSPELVVSTLPGGVQAPHASERLRRDAVLFDVAYDPWPSSLATAWAEVGGRVVPGIEMLLHQAIGQIRFFLHGDESRALPDESAVLAAMRTSIGAEAPVAPWQD